MSSITRITPEGFDIANGFLTYGTVDDTAEQMGIARHEVVRVLQTAEVKRYLDGVYLDMGYRNRNKIGAAFDRIIEAKLAEAEETGTYSSKDLAELLHPAPPRIVRRNSSAPLIADADAVVLDRRDARITPLYAPLVQVATGYPWDLFSRGGWISTATAGDPPFASAWGLRFLTDSPRVELRTVQSGNLRWRVDGLPLTPADSTAMPDSDPDGWTQPGIDFGDAFAPELLRILQSLSL